MTTRIMVQGPTGLVPTELVDRRRRIEGLPHDVLVALEAMALLAEQGNEIAKLLLTRERIRLGIDRPQTFYRR